MADRAQRSGVRKFGSGRPLVVVAFGGNALMPPEDDGSLTSQLKRASDAARVLHRIVRAGHRILLVHGNGPQVGQELIRSEEASTKLPLVSLDAAVASTQGSMGYQLEMSLYNTSHTLRVASILTMVEVAGNDPGFQTPSKPIGPFFSSYRARDLQRRMRWQMVEDAGRGWRKVVASPKPTAIVNLEAIDAVVSRMDVVIAGGGGGIPVVREASGRLVGVEAVVDKDLTAALLGQVLGAHMLIILTGVSEVSLDWGKPQQRPISEMTVTEAARWLEQGQFPPGSMGPKVRAAMTFAKATRQTAAIGSVANILQVLKGKGGTRVVAG